MMAAYGELKILDNNFGTQNCTMTQIGMAATYHAGKNLLENGKWYGAPRQM